ncbi:MAG: prolipoprotein diacylglyceryl transferase [Bacteroidia bacterium]|nr:prolipoprotein diacylglyceryl transferase [Bacteroidia bacterium]
MISSIFINPAVTGKYFPLAFLLAMMVISVSVIIDGYRRNYPVKEIWLLAASGILFGIAGIKAFTIPVSEWFYALKSFSLPPAQGKVASGVFLGLIFVLFSSRWLRFRGDITRGFAFAFPLAMIIQRTGCLFSGCCFGAPAQLPWSVQYSAGSDAFQAQLERNLVHSYDTVSLPVHPWPVYDIISCLFVILLVYRFRNSWKANGSLLIFAIILYGFFRFFLDFLRDPAANNSPAGEFLSLKNAQWLLIFTRIILLIILVLRERKAGNIFHSSISKEAPVYRSVLLVLFLILVFRSAGRWFDIFEKTAICLILVPATVITGWNAWKRLTLPGFRIMTALVSLSAFLLMSQTYIPGNNKDAIAYNEFDFGTAIGRYYKQVSQATDYDQSCFNTYWFSNPHNIEHSYVIGSIGISRKKQFDRFKRNAFGIHASFGSEYEKGIDTVFDVRHNIIDINPSFSSDSRWFGFAFGLHFGNLRFADIYEKVNKIGDYNHTVQDLAAFPELSFRFGPYDIFYMDMSLAGFYKPVTPLMDYQIGLGTGLGKVDGTCIRAGWSAGGFYGNAIIPVNDQILAEALLISNFRSRYDAKNNISVGFHYRFGFHQVHSKSGRKKNN